MTLQRARRAEAAARHDQRADLRRQGLRDADLAAARPPRAAASSRPPTSLRAVNEQNAQFAAGKVGQAPYATKEQELVYTVTTRGRLADPKEFEEIIVRSSPGGSAVRLKDVARVELGSKDYDFIGRYNGKSATLVGIFLQPGANALEVAETREEPRARSCRRAFPPGLSYAVAVRHHALRRGVDPRGGEDAGRGDAAGVPRRLPVPAELARHADPDHRRAGVADRHLRRAC